MKKPNVILVLTDDQGYADLSCHGNPWIQTPNIDAFHEDCMYYNDFHVAPLCAPTRGGLMTGRRALRNGVWATCWGRSILKNEEYTLGNLFNDNGYKTGLFGKWHLGDNYPGRPEDRGFQTVTYHKGGGVGQTPDFWGNSYFDDTYFTNSEPIPYEGYCTDVWFDQAKKFISENKDEPFFAYIATNAPHSPYIVAEKYTKLYSDNPDIPHPDFYGMITNIDENFGELRSFLKENDLEDNTILIFMTDNGSSGAALLDQTQHARLGYNANMRGMKGSYYEGGHRVPFFIRYPNGKIVGGKSCDDLCMHTDIMPTLAELCDMNLPEGLNLDGKSFAKTLYGEKMDERFEFLQYRQHTNIPEKWTNAVLYNKFRLIGGTELYDISTDPSQSNDISAENPEMVAKLREAHESWWSEVADSIQEYTPITVGHPVENPTVLNAMDVLGDVNWAQSTIAKAIKSCGIWCVHFDHAGDYSFALRRWPVEARKAINEQIEMDEFNALADYMPFKDWDKAPVFKSAHITLDGKTYSQDITENMEEAVFDMHVDITEDTTVEAWFITDDEQKYGAYYIDVLAK